MGETESHNCVSGQTRIICPGCGFSKELPRHQVPPEATDATCPKCACRFPLLAQNSSKADVEPQPAAQQADQPVVADNQNPKKTKVKPEELLGGGRSASRNRPEIRPPKRKTGIIVLALVIITTAVFLLCSGIVVKSIASARNGQHLGKTIKVQPQGVFAKIDTNRTRKVIEDMSSQDRRRVSRAIDKIIADPGKFQPPAFFALAASLYKEGKAEDAIFWLNAGRVRARFDANRCADVSARQAVRVLSLQMPPELIKEQFKDLDRFRSLVVKAIEWDRSTPYDYDHRWINLHGMGAMIAGLAKEAGEDRKPAETSLPEGQWTAIAEQTREKYLQELDEVIAGLRNKSNGSR